MKIRIETPVRGYYADVFARFDRELLEALTPPGVELEVLRFDGIQVGDIVQIRLKPPGLPAQIWISEVTENDADGKQAWFVDMGTKLPVYLSRWEHRHIVRQLSPEQCLIVDEVKFRSPFWISDAMLAPVFYGIFYYRKSVYQRIFGKP